jgi:uncharacterized protein
MGTVAAMETGTIVMLVNEIVEYALSRVTDCVVVDVRIGLGYTAVRLENGGCGVAYTLHEKEYESCCVVPEAGRLTGRKVSELLPWMKQSDVTASAVGLAALNAILPMPDDAEESDIAAMFPVRPEDTVGMVGYFRPLVEPLKRQAGKVYIFERKPDPGYGILPETESRNLLPRCQVVILSATTLLNHTIDEILDLCGSAREIAILGPSTPFIPEVFGGHGVTMLSGLHVVDPDRILKIVSEGGGTRQFGSSVRKLTLRLPLRRIEQNLPCREGSDEGENHDE